MTKKLITVLCTALLTFGCTSTSVGLNYYVFNAPSSALPAARETNQTVAVDAIVLADYLRQSSLVMQIDEHKLYFSSQDLWAEGLQGAMQKALLADLNSSGTTLFIAGGRDTQPTYQASLSVQIDHLLVTNNSTVMLSGHYDVADLSDNTLINQAFFVELALEEDGFAHAVVKQRMLVSQLAKQIQTAVSALVIQ
ncbi:MAG: hypothetical protein GW763_10125 [Paraglaciecola sp.]|nr:hypothetical protein [Paraglaciecola sp.]NCT48326.1 hypothetical protein [Paraglaciecola sp.]